MKQFRLLKPDEIECRVSTCSEKGVSILLYKTARTDADLLDEKFGADRWENDFKLVDGVLYGGIGVDYHDNGTLTWKWDAGTESNTEAEKGRASDAFKRAGFKHGIGRELYSAPFIWVSADKCSVKQNKNGKWQCYDSFDVSDIGYDAEERINRLRITLKGKTVYELGKSNSLPDTPAPPPAPAAPICEKCGMDIKTTPLRNGEVWNAVDMMAYSRRRFNHVYCAKCIKVLNNAN